VRIYGEDLDVLRRKAEDVRAAIASIRGVADLKVQIMDTGQNKSQYIVRYYYREVITY
jgi:Cu/Ag efflux pump CusA